MACRDYISVERLPSDVDADAEPYDDSIKEIIAEGLNPTAKAAESDDSVLSDVLKQGQHNLKKSVQTILGEKQRDSIITQLQGNARSNESLPERDIPEDEYPPGLKAEFYDIFILAHEDDRTPVYEFKDMLQTESRLVLECKRKIKVLTSFDNVGMGLGEFTAVEYAMNYCTYVFLYITKSFCEDDGAKLHGDACLMKTIESGSTTRWCVVPIHTRNKKNRNYNVPYGINVLKGMSSYTQDKFFFANIKKLIEDKLSIRLGREKQLLARKNSWKQKELLRREEEKNKEEAELASWKMQMEKERSSRQESEDRLEAEKAVRETIPTTASQSFITQMMPSGHHSQDVDLLKQRQIGLCDPVSEVSEITDKPYAGNMQETIASGAINSSISLLSENDIEEDAYDSGSLRIGSDMTLKDDMSYQFSHSSEQPKRQRSMEPSEYLELPSALPKYPYSSSQTNLKSDQAMKGNMGQGSQEYSADDRQTVVKEIHHHHYSQAEPKEQPSEPTVVYHIIGANAVQIGEHNQVVVDPPAQQQDIKRDSFEPKEGPSGQKFSDAASACPDPENAHRKRYPERSPSFPSVDEISMTSCVDEHRFDMNVKKNSFEIGDSPSAKCDATSVASSQPSADGSCKEGRPVMSNVARVLPLPRQDQTVAKQASAVSLIRESPDGMEDQAVSSDGHQNPGESANTVPKVVDSQDRTESSEGGGSEQTLEKEFHGFTLDSCSEAEEDFNVIPQPSENIRSGDDLQTDSAKRSKDRKNKNCTVS